ncbi:nuclear transport factor 2 family protein [Spongiimicrobium sp. 2-473A-2-J]|uniref:nuclear transport factor 2 family protein n=1 Tax=Eudoraea algarum TaxID=3417568 RepID=UPI003D35EF94
MKYKSKVMGIVLIALCLSVVGYGQDSWSPEQKEIVDVISRLSATTAPGGGGAEAYGDLLADDFSRWTIGSEVTNKKEKWIEGIAEWFADGWRVSDRKQQYLEILVLDSLAHTRRIVTETYLGPKGDTSTSKAALSEIWIKRNGKWLLYRVNIHPMDSK